MKRLKGVIAGPELEILNYLLHMLVGSYVIGWLILAWSSKDVPIFNDDVWRMQAFIAFCLTIWLAVSLSVNALIWWSSATIIAATIRSLAYVSDGLVSAFGVWMLVMSGVGITSLAILSVQVLTGRLPKEPA